MIWDVKMIWDNQCVSDDVDQILEQWRNARPDIDPSPMELTGRLQRAAVFTREQLTSNFTAAGLEPGQFDDLPRCREGWRAHRRRTRALGHGQCGGTHQPCG